MTRDYEEQKIREYECKHGDSPLPAFKWDGRTMCSDCCSHEYRGCTIDHNGEWVCTLCYSMLGAVYHLPRPRTPRRRYRNPTVRVFDENGKRRRVRYQK